MSTSISICRAWAAANGDEEAYESVLSISLSNMRYGYGWRLMPCDCDEACKPATRDAMEKFDKRITSDLRRIEEEYGRRGFCMSASSGCCGSSSSGCTCDDGKRCGHVQEVLPEGLMKILAGS